MNSPAIRIVHLCPIGYIAATIWSVYVQTCMEATMEQILVIDDHDEVLSITGWILERAGYHVSRASGADEGIDIYKHESVSLISKCRRRTGYQ